MNTPISATSTLAGDRTPPRPDSVVMQDATIEGDSTIAVNDVPLSPCLDEKQPSMGIVDDNVVDWDGPDDPECPRNWPTSKKLPFVIITSSMIVCVSFGSSVFAPSEAVFADGYNVPTVVGQLGVALWIFGFFAGPTFFGPVSELFGHLVPMTIAMIGLAIFQIPIAVGTNVETVLVSRFISGVFGSGVMAVVSGTYFELYEPIPRGVALASSAVGINLGSTFAPIVGAYVTYNGHSWQWGAWVTLILDVVLLVLALFFVRETSSRKILRQKAKRMRFETKNWALHAKSEETPVEFQDIVQRYLTKPIRIIVREPILIVLTAYLTLVYGILYLSFQAFPKSYQQRGWSIPASELPFIAVALGILSSFLTCSWFTMTWYKRKVIAHNGLTVPEWRIPPMALGAVILPPSLLWFAWSGNVHWLSQVLASYFIGYGVQLIFITGIIYLVDVYQQHTNSAMAIHIIVRSFISASFPLWSNIMYDHLGISWGTSLLAFVCILMCIAPIVFWYFGAKIRSWSRFSVRSAI